MSSVLISIIVPAYNIESHIGRCLDSILAQTHKRIEIIIVDDGSTDGTGIIIDQYASIDQRIIPIHKENGGVTSARIDGIKKHQVNIWDLWMEMIILNQKCLRNCWIMR